MKFNKHLISKNNNNSPVLRMALSVSQTESERKIENFQLRIILTCKGSFSEFLAFFSLQFICLHFHFTRIIFFCVWERKSVVAIGHRNEYRLDDDKWENEKSCLMEKQFHYYFYCEWRSLPFQAHKHTPPFPWFSSIFNTSYTQRALIINQNHFIFFPFATPSSSDAVLLCEKDFPSTSSSPHYVGGGR